MDLIMLGKYCSVERCHNNNNFKRMGMTRRPMREGTKALLMLGGLMIASFLQP